MIPVRPPPPPHPQWFPPPPPLWCGAVVGCFPPPPPPLWCGVVWCGCGLLPPSLWCGVVRVGVGFGGSPPSPCGVVWVGWFPPCIFGSAWGVWQTHAHDDIDDDDDDNHDHQYHNHLGVSLVGRRVSSAHVPADDYRFIDRGGTIFVTVVALGQSE